MIIDLKILIDYFDKLSIAVNTIFPEEITCDNVYDYNFEFDYKHPDWVNAFFPLIMIYYRPKAGKLRDSKSVEVMYQNQNNVLTQLVWTADDYGIYKRKNSHKGFSNIVAAIRPDPSEGKYIYTDKQKPKKFRNFIEFGRLRDPEDLYLQGLCKVLQEDYPCDSTGQLRLI